MTTPPEPKATEPTCQHREWLETDEHFPNGPVCGKPATHRVCDETDKVVCAEHKCRCNLPLAKPAKATEPSDEAEPVCAECGDDFAWNEDADRSEQKPYCNLCAQDLVYRFRAEVEALKAERDKLHAAIAWVEGHAGGLEWRELVLAYTDMAQVIWYEHHDGTPAGRAAALVRLWERCK